MSLCVRVGARVTVAGMHVHGKYTAYSLIDIDKVHINSLANRDTAG